MISPLLSNLYLHWFDKVFHREGGPAQWAKAKLVRYADDFVVLARYQGRAACGVDRSEDRRVDGVGDQPGQDAGDEPEASRSSSSTFWDTGFATRGIEEGGEHRYLNVTISEKALKRERQRLRERISKERCFQAAAPTDRRAQRPS